MAPHQTFPANCSPRRARSGRSSPRNPESACRRRLPITCANSGIPDAQPDHIPQTLINAMKLFQSPERRKAKLRRAGRPPALTNAPPRTDLGNEPANAPVSTHFGLARHCEERGLWRYSSRGLVCSIARERAGNTTGHSFRHRSQHHCKLYRADS